MTKAQVKIFIFMRCLCCTYNIVLLVFSLLSQNWFYCLIVVRGYIATHLFLCDPYIIHQLFAIQLKHATIVNGLQEKHLIGKTWYMIDKYFALHTYIPWILPHLVVNLHYLCACKTTLLGECCYRKSLSPQCHILQ